jgi:hypothetical protein
LIKDEPWSVWIGPKKISKDLSSTIYDIVHATEAKDYWLSKDRVPHDTYDSNNWDALHKAMEESPRSRRIFIMKHSAGMCGVGKFMHRWKERDNPNCPRCGQFEDAPHVWLCKGCDTNSVWTSSLDKLQDWMTSVQTDPDIQDAIINYLDSWRNDTTPPNPPPHIDDLLQAQTTLGWRMFFKGWIPVSWEETQQAYYNLVRSRRTGRRWTISLIKKLWDVAWDLWDHRNGILHHTENPLAAEEMHRVDQSLRTSFMSLSQNSLSPCDQYLLRLPLHQLLEKDFSFKKNLAATS